MPSRPSTKGKTVSTIQMGMNNVQEIVISSVIRNEDGTQPGCGFAIVSNSGESVYVPAHIGRLTQSHRGRVVKAVLQRNHRPTPEWKAIFLDWAGSINADPSAGPELKAEAEDGLTLAYPRIAKQTAMHLQKCIRLVLANAKSAMTSYDVAKAINWHVHKGEPSEEELERTNASLYIALQKGEAIKVTLECGPGVDKSERNKNAVVLWLSSLEKIGRAPEDQ